MTIVPGSTLRQRRRRDSASSTSSGWSFDKVDWSQHVESQTEQIDTPTEGAPAQSTEDAPAVPATPTPGPTASPLLTLPPDILVHHIVPQLPYPALLSLRLSHPHFYHSSLLYPSRAPAIRLRVAWLKSRSERGLAVPHSSRRLRFETDAEFVTNIEVCQMLRREVYHGECGDECRVTGLEGRPCPGRRRLGPRSYWGPSVLGGAYVDMTIPSPLEQFVARTRLGRALYRSRRRRFIRKGAAMVALSALFTVTLWTMSLVLAALGWTFAMLGSVSTGSILAASIAAAGFLVTMGERRAISGWQRRR